jgi:hypothetical protein
MSYYFAIVIKDSVLFSCDRTFVNKETGENRSDWRRYSLLSNDKVFLPSGILAFCVAVQDTLHGFFESGLEVLEVVAPTCSELFLGSYKKEKERIISRLKVIGKTANTETDCLYGGLDENGVPFILSLSSKDDFQLKLTKPISFIALNQKPEILSFVKKTLQTFMGAASDKKLDEVWELGRRFLPTIIQKISATDSLVSRNGDLIFVSNSGVQTYEF